jgi:hypothetical protein
LEQAQVKPVRGRSIWLWAIGLLAWLKTAATEAGWHRPDDAPRLIHTDEITSESDARERVMEFTRQRGFLARERPTTVEEQHRRWGQELLDQINRA